MTQNNFRKEPVFGEPTIATEESASEGVTQSNTHNKPYVSLRSSQSPGYTFTPVMKRPQVTFETSTAEPAKSAKEFQFTPTEVEQTEVEELISTLNTENLDMNDAHKEEVSKEEEKSIPSNEGFTTERIIPNASSAGNTATASTKTETIKAKMPPKTRRLLLVGLLALALLVLFFLLKPSTPETVEELQSQQSSNLPIEFRPVDEAEAKRAEEQARLEQEAAMKAQEQQQAQQTQEQVQPQPSVNNAQPSATAPTQAPAQVEQTVVNQPQANTEQQTVEKPIEKPVVAQPEVKPQTNVVRRLETQEKPQTKVLPKATTESKATTKVERAPQPQKEAAKAVSKPAVKTEVEKSDVPATATKTMTVPKGVSLMQVFRDNSLNISDVNAMSKVNNVVSNLKVGERVTVRLDKNNRVVEMSIGSGGKFTRQANGSYTFK